MVLRVIVAAVLLAGCEFEHGVGMPGEVPDAGPDMFVGEAKAYAVASVSRGAGQLLSIAKFGDTGFVGDCPDHATTKPFTALSGHPSHPYIYAVGDGFQGFAMACGSMTQTAYMPIGLTTSVQRISLDAPGRVGFFSIDGPQNEGVFRFTTATDGTPTLMGKSIAPEPTGPTRLSDGTGELFTAGGTTIYNYKLNGVQYDLNGPSEFAVICNAVDLVVSSQYLLGFCSNDGSIQRYTRTPFAFEKSVGALGTVEQVVQLPGDRAIAVTTPPAKLMLIDLGSGTPTWTVGPAVGTKVTSMAISADGKFLVTSRQVDAATGELAVWSVSNDSIKMLGVRAVAGTVTAVAVTPVL
jgi:hypothetical protein